MPKNKHYGAAVHHLLRAHVQEARAGYDSHAPDDHWHDKLNKLSEQHHDMGEHHLSKLPEDLQEKAHDKAMQKYENWHYDSIFPLDENYDDDPQYTGIQDSFEPHPADPSPQPSRRQRIIDSASETVTGGGESTPPQKGHLSLVKGLRKAANGNLSIKLAKSILQKADKEDCNEMTSRHLKKIAHHVQEMQESVQNVKDLPDWVESKLAQASSAMSEIAHFTSYDSQNENLTKADRCWKGYKPAEGKKPYSEDSCVKKSMDKPQDGKALEMLQKMKKQRDIEKSQTGSSTRRGRKKLGDFTQKQTPKPETENPKPQAKPSQEPNVWNPSKMEPPKKTPRWQEDAEKKQKENRETAIKRAGGLKTPSGKKL